MNLTDGNEAVAGATPEAPSTGPSCLCAYYTIRPHQTAVGGTYRVALRYLTNVAILPFRRFRQLPLDMRWNQVVEKNRRGRYNYCGKQLEGVRGQGLVDGSERDNSKKPDVRRDVAVIFVN